MSPVISQAKVSAMAFTMRSRKPPHSHIVSLGVSAVVHLSKLTDFLLIFHPPAALRRGGRAGNLTMNGSHCRNPTQTMTLQLNRREGVERSQRDGLTRNHSGVPFFLPPSLPPSPPPSLASHISRIAKLFVCKHILPWQVGF